MKKNWASVKNPNQRLRWLGGTWGQRGVLWITVAEAETAPTMWLATYINSVEQKIEMEMWALKECDSHLPLDRG